MRFGIVSGARRQSVEDDTAQWLARHDRGDLEPTEAAAFDAWIKNPLHAEAFARADDLMDLFDLEDGSDATFRALRQEARQAGRRSYHLWPSVAAAAALLIAVATGAMLTIWHGGNQTPGVSVATRSAEPRPVASTQVTSAAATPEFNTAIGERRTIRLSDGTKVTLDTNTRLVVAFDNKRRLVRLLRGQALFEVAHNARWPFTVQAADRQVTALGTVFEVSNFPGRLRVLLVEGRVVVERTQDAEMTTGAIAVPPIILKPGQSLVAELGTPQQVTAVDVGRQLMWRDGFVQFDDETLAQAVLQINRYIPRPIKIADDRVGNLRVSGVFRTGDARQFVETVKTVLPIEARSEADGTIQLGPAQSK